MKLMSTYSPGENFPFAVHYSQQDTNEEKNSFLLSNQVNGTLLITEQQNDLYLPYDRFQLHTIHGRQF